MSNRKVRRALEKAVKQWATENSKLVIYQGTKSSNTEPEKIEMTLIPDEVDAPTIGGFHSRHTGVVRLLVKKGEVDKGMGAVETIAESLFGYFYRGRVFTEVDYKAHIEKPVTVRTGFVDGMYTVVPVDIFYRVDFFTN